MAYLYRHVRLDKNEVFYVGIGSDEDGKYVRANDVNPKSRRNKHWIAIATKTPFEVEIVLDDLTWEQACSKEREFIALYKRVNDGGTLCNYALGGDGAYGYRHSSEAKEAIRKSSTNRKHSEEAKAKISAKRKGMKFSKEHIENLKRSHKGIGRSIESRIKQSITAAKKREIINNLLK